MHTNLPSSNEPEKMKKIVMSESRFSNYIKEKINDETEL